MNDSDYKQAKTPEDLLKFMTNNIHYGYIGKQGKKYINQDEEYENDWFEKCIVQSGDGILLTKCGTCWDQVELERKWFKGHKFEFVTIFAWFEKNEPNNYPTHTFLAFQGDNKWYWFENSFVKCRGIHKFDTLEQLVKTVNKNQLKYAIKSGVAKEQDKVLIKNYIYEKPKPNLGVSEYLKYVTSGKKI